MSFPPAQTTDTSAQTARPALQVITQAYTIAPSRRNYTGWIMRNQGPLFYVFMLVECLFLAEFLVAITRSASVTTIIATAVAYSLFTAIAMSKSLVRIQWMRDILWMATLAIGTPYIVLLYAVAYGFIQEEAKGSVTVPSNSTDY